MALVAEGKEKVEIVQNAFKKASIPSKRLDDDFLNTSGAYYICNSTLEDKGKDEFMYC